MVEGSRRGSPRRFPRSLRVSAGDRDRARARRPRAEHGGVPPFPAWRPWRTGPPWRAKLRREVPPRCCWKRSGSGAPTSWCLMTASRIVLLYRARGAPAPWVEAPPGRSVRSRSRRRPSCESRWSPIAVGCRCLAMSSPPSASRDCSARWVSRPGAGCSRTSCARRASSRPRSPRSSRGPSGTVESHRSPRQPRASGWSRCWRSPVSPTRWLTTSV